jgi:hypothetical protein
MKHIFASFTFLAFASPASAAVLDFTDASIFGILDGKSSESVEVEGIGMTVTANPTPDATIVQSEKGLGINSQDGYWAGRQIQGDEVLSIEFDEPQEVTEFTVTNLFNWVEGEFALQIEEGEFVINQGEVDEFSGEFTATDTYGKFSFDLTSISAASAVSSFSFNAKGAWTNVFDSGLTLASITTNTVPEPDSGGLLVVMMVLIGSTLVVSERRRARA